MNTVDAFGFCVFAKIFTLIQNITGASAKQQVKIARRVSLAVYFASTIRYVIQDAKWGVASSALMMFCVYIQKIHLNKMCELSMQLPDSAYQWAMEVMSNRFLRTLWFFLILLGTPLAIVDAIFHHEFDVLPGLLAIEYALYVSIIPGGTKKSIFSKAKDKLKELAASIKPVPRLVPIPI